MLIRNLSASLLVLLFVASSNTAAQPATSPAASRASRVEQPAREGTSISPTMVRKMRESSVSFQAVIGSVHIPMEAGISEEAVETTGQPPSTPPPESDENVRINLALLKRVEGVSDAAVFQDGVKTDVANAQSVQLTKGDILAVRSADAQPVTLRENGSNQAASPTRLITLDDAGVTRQLAIVHRSQGLTWDQMQRAFTGALLVGVVDRGQPNDQAGLPTAIPVQLLAAGDAATPNELSIDRIGGRFQKVNVAIADPDDPYSIRLVSPLDPDLPDAALPLRRMQLVLMAPAQIDALGIGNGEVTVRARNGRLRSGESVTLHLDNGELEKSTLIVDENGIASTHVRSTGLGNGTLSVIAGPYSAQPVTVRYAPPILLLVATILGAMLGASVFVYSLTRGGGFQGRSLVDWLVGVIVGIGATAMVYAGMKLPEWIPMPRALVGAIVPFAFAFVCAAMGAALINFLTGRRLPKLLNK